MYSVQATNTFFLSEYKDADNNTLAHIVFNLSYVHIFSTLVRLQTTTQEKYVLE